MLQWIGRKRDNAMPNLGPTELFIILIIVVLLFGVGRVSRIGGELGSAVANFRKGLQQGAKEPNIERLADDADAAEKTNQA